MVPVVAQLQGGPSQHQADHPWPVRRLVGDNIQALVAAVGGGGVDIAVVEEGSEVRAVAVDIAAVGTVEGDIVAGVDIVVVGADVVDVVVVGIEDTEVE